MMAARRGSAISEDPHAKGMGMGKLGGKNPVISKKKWRQASARPTFDVHKYSPSIMVWSEAECNVSCPVWPFYMLAVLGLPCGT